MKSIRASHPIWEVARIERDKDGRDDGYVVCGLHWNEADAAVERDRLERENTDDSFYFVVAEETVTVAYPADEHPPWVDDPDRLKRRGYEVHRDD
jgi:hypothetical protein